MHDFPSLLIRTSEQLGTLARVASVLQVAPKQVYDWAAGFERPPAERVKEFSERLRMRAFTIPAPARRRWCDLAAA